MSKVQSEWLDDPNFPYPIKKAEPRFGDGREEDWFAWLCKEKEEMAKGKIHKVMGEFKRRTLHSGSKKGPKVTSRKQAVAIALSEARRGKK